MVRVMHVRALKLVALSFMLLIGVASISLPQAEATWTSVKTAPYDAWLYGHNGGGPTNEHRAKAFRNGTIWVEVAAGLFAWAEAWGSEIWYFSTYSTLYNVKVSADFSAYGYVGTWFGSAQLWFTLTVNGQSGEYYEWFGYWWTGEITRSKTVSVNFGTMNPGTTYRIEAKVKIRIDNGVFVDLESNGPPPLGSGGLNKEGYGRVLRMVVEAP